MGKFSTTTTTTKLYRPYKDINILVPKSQTITTKAGITKQTTSLYKRFASFSIIGISLMAILVVNTQAQNYENRFDNLPNANADYYITTDEYLDNVDFGSQGADIVEIIFGNYNPTTEKLEGGVFGTLSTLVDTANQFYQSILVFLGFNGGNEINVGSFIDTFGTERMTELATIYDRTSNDIGKSLAVYTALTSTEKTYFLTANASTFNNLEIRIFLSTVFYLTYFDPYGEFGGIKFFWTMPNVYDLVDLWN